MRQLTLSADRFAEWVNSVIPGGYRQIMAQDVRDMTDSGLIRRYGYYIHSDLETVRAILSYEQLLEKRLKKPLNEEKLILATARCVANNYLFSLKVKRGDRESIAAPFYIY